MSHPCAIQILSITTILLSTVNAVAGTETKPNAPSSLPNNLKVVGNMLYLSADDGVHGRELWGVGPGETAGIRLLADVDPGLPSSNPHAFQDVGGRLAFAATRFGEGSEPWVYDPKRNEAFLVENIGPGRTSSEPCLGRLANGVFFLASRNPSRLWSMNPDSLKLTLLKSPGELGEFPFDVLANGYFLLGATSLLYVSNGTPDGTKLLFESRKTWIQWITAIGNKAVFSAGDIEHGNEIFVTDGTPEGTGLLKDICPGPAGAGVAQVVGFGSTAFFQADDGVHGSEIWMTDGTPDGTRLVRDINPGKAGSDPHYFVQGTGGAYFAANDGVSGKELWHSDGSGKGTVKVTSLSPGPQAGAIWSLMNAGSRLYFCANSYAHGEEVFYTEGKPGDVKLLADIVPGTGSSGPANLTLFGEKVYFTCDDGLHGEELWFSDGTESGTRLAMDIRPASPGQAPSSLPRDLTPMNGSLIFSAADLQHGREMWISDGSAEGTRLVRDISPGMADSAPGDITVQGTRIFFAATTAASGRELWVTDGTDAKTALVQDLWPGPRSSEPRCLTAGGKGLYFIADSDGSGNGLYFTDGTPSGTSPIVPDGTGQTGVTVTGIAAYEGEVYAHVTDGQVQSVCRIMPGSHGLQSLVMLKSAVDTPDPCALEDAEWRVSSPLKDQATKALLLFPGGRRAVATMPASLGDSLLFQAYSPGMGMELWKASTGVSSIQMVADIFPGPPSSCPTCLTPVGETLFFIADHSEEGRILWQTDGTVGGTAMANLYRPDGTKWPAAISAFEMTALNDKEALLIITIPYFGDIGDRELALLSARGQFPQLSVCSFEPIGGKFRALHQLVRSGDRIFFTCDGGGHGEELWLSDGTVEGTHLVKDIL